MFAILGLAALEQSINYWLNLDAATRIACNRLQGKLLRLVVDQPNISVDVYFDLHKVRLHSTPLGMDVLRVSSLFEQRPYDKQHTIHTADTTLHTRTLTAMFTLLRTADTGGNIPVSGDIALLQQIQHILAHTQADIGNALSPLIGDIAADRLASAINSGFSTVHKTSKTLTQNIAEWLNNDSGLLAQRWQYNRLARNTQQLQTDIERTAAKITQLESARLNRIPAKAAMPSPNNQSNE